MEWLCTDLSDTGIVEDDGAYHLRTPEHSYEDCLYFPGPGDYEVVLFVDGEVVAAGEATVDGVITDTYEWHRYLDGEPVSYKVSFTYTFDEYQRYAEDDTVRHVQHGLSDSRFVVVDDAILRLSQALADEYESVHGRDASKQGQDYADYLLSFVQCVITYPVELVYEDGAFIEKKDGNGDLFLYGSDEYWAYPMETLFHRMGDCEDTSILLCALYCASGYDSSLVRVPGHVVVGVEIDGFEPNDRYSEYYQKAELTLDGHLMRLCETAYERYVPLGFTNKDMGFGVSDIRGYTLVAPLTPLERGQT